MSNQFRRLIARFILIVFLANSQIGTLAYAANVGVTIDPAVHGAISQEAKDFYNAPSTKRGNASQLPSIPALQDSIPQYDTTNPQGYSGVGDSYYQRGRNDATAIGNIANAGNDVRTASKICNEVCPASCPAGDTACEITKLECENRHEACLARQLTDSRFASPDPFTAEASQMAKVVRDGVNPDPLSILGMNTPNANGGSVCVETTATTDATVKSQTCIETQWKTLQYVSKLPVTTTLVQNTPECLNGGTLSADGTTCNNQTYSCPDGGNINGITCTSSKPPVTTLSYTSPVCTDPAYQTMSADLATCSNTTYSCPDGGTLNGTTCTETTAASWVYGSANCSSISLSPISLTGDGVTTSITPSCLSSGVGFSSNATGSVGSEFTDYGSISFSSSYTNEPIAALAPIFQSGVHRQVGAFVSGGCANDTCSYTVSSNYVAANTAWQTYTGCSGYSRNKVTTTLYKQNATPTTAYSTTFLESYAITDSSCRDRSKTLSFPRLSPSTSLGSTTLTFTDPRVKVYSCPTGSTLTGTSCVRSYPATATTGSVSSGCLGGQVTDAAGFVTKSAESYVAGGQSGGTRTCQSTNYTCQPSYIGNTTQQCQISYPATGINVATTPGCQNGSLVKDEFSIRPTCNFLDAVGWQSAGISTVNSTGYMTSYKQIDLACNFSATDTNQFIALESNTGVQNIIIDRVLITPSDGSTPISLEAETKTAANAAPINKIADPLAMNGFAHEATASSIAISDIPGRAWGLHASDVDLTHFSKSPATVSFFIRTSQPDTYAVDPNQVIEIRAAGSDDVNPTQYGVYKNGGRIYVGNPVWNLVTFDPSLGIAFSRVFSTWASPPEANNMANHLNAIPNGTLFALYTYDEPSSNVVNNAFALDAIANAGGTRSLAASLKFRESYILLAEKGGRVYAEGKSPRYSNGITVSANVGETLNTQSISCVTQAYTCPAGQTMNGNICESVTKTDLLANPNCVNLGFKPEVGQEAFYCTEQTLDECSTMAADNCTLKSSSCVYTDEVVGSPTFGDCLASENVYECPVSGKTVTVQECGFDPVCFNGSCYEPPGTMCEGIVETKTKTVKKSCTENRAQVLNTCSMDLTMDAFGNVSAAAPGADCAVYANNPDCIQIPIVKDFIGNYNGDVGYSCLSAPTDDCAPLLADTTCKLDTATSACVDPEILSYAPSGNPTALDTGRCLTFQKDYACLESYQAPGDECTRDLATMLTGLEVGVEAGSYMKNLGTAGFDPATMRIFPGEYSRCDRRNSTSMGIDFGNKSCCSNIDSPDPKTNNDVMMAQVTSNVIQFVDFTVTAASSYAYDFMMNSEAYWDAATALWQSNIISDGMASTLTANAGASDLFSSVSYTPAVSYAGLGLSYGGATATTAGATAATTTTTAGVSTTSYSYGLGGGFDLTFSPTSFYIYAAIQLYSMYQQALACDEEDFKTSTKTKAGLCYVTGTYCAQENCGVFGCTCNKLRTNKCCYNTVLAKLFNEQGKAQLGITGNADTCEGFTPDQFGQLDLSKFNFDEFISQALTQAKSQLPTDIDLQAVSNRVQGNIQSGQVLKRNSYIP